MIWLTWRQFRLSALVAVAILAVFAGALLNTAPGLNELARDSGLTDCRSDCVTATEAFLSQLRQWGPRRLHGGGLALVLLLPALVGVFWGAPLVARELESGTHRLVWTQTVSRRRWLAVKLAAVGAAAVLLTGLCALAAAWWARPIDRAEQTRMLPEFFSGRGVAPLGYAAFAFVLGVLTGILVRRTVLAMAITLVLVVGAQIATPFLLRPLLSAPVTEAVALDTDRIESIGINTENEMRLTAEAPVTGAWVLENVVTRADGTVFTGPPDPSRCGPQATGGRKGCTEWIDSLGLRQQVRYIPGDRFWTLQWRELGVLLTLTVILSMFCLWWIRRRLA